MSYGVYVSTFMVPRDSPHVPGASFVALFTIPPVSMHAANLP